jgi:hypothetical protein
MAKTLAVLRDTCACFVTCGHEGVYWPDKSCGEDVEDQPHPFSAVEPSYRETVFRRDDCEGRASQVQCMAGLLKSMAVVRDGRLFNLVKWQQSTGKIPLRLSDALLCSALRACIFLGDMLLSGQCELHNTVGDACFGQAAGGHSFSIASDKYKTHCIVDSSGWQRLADTGDILHYDAIVADLGGPAGAGAQYSVTVDADRENELYCRIFLGHDHIYFSKNEANELQFGTTIASMRKHGLHTATTPPQQAQCFRMKTRDFILALCGDGCAWRNANAITGAEQVLHQYDGMQRNLPLLRRMTRPPVVTLAAAFA